MNARKRVETATTKGPRRSGGNEFKLNEQGLKSNTPRAWGMYLMGIGSRNFLGGAKRAIEIGPFERKKKREGREDFTP